MSSVVRLGAGTQQPERAKMGNFGLVLGGNCVLLRLYLFFCLWEWKMEGQQNPNQGCCWDLCDKSHPEALREVGISPSIPELDGCFPKTVPSLGASLSH